MVERTEPVALVAQLSLRRLFVIVTVWAAFLGFCMLAKHFVPLHSPLWGPLHFVYDASPENRSFGQLVALWCVATVSPLALRVTPGFVVSAGCGLFAWILMGLIGAGLNV